MAIRITSFVVAAVLAVGCDGRGPQARDAATSEPAASASESVQARDGAVTGQTSAASERSALSTLAAAVLPAPEFREVTIPSGTVVSLVLETAVGSDSSRVEDTVRATVSKPVVVAGLTALPQGTELVGSVTGAQRSGKVKGRASVSMRFSRLTVWDETQQIRTAAISRQAAATKKADATKIGVGAGAGALIGAIAGGGKGAAIGTAVGAGGGTGVVLATRGDEVHLAPGTPLRTTIQEPLTVRIPVE